jgi:tRNA(Ile)-lysidine synthase
LSCDWKLGLKVAHFEHGLRGQRSEDDALFVEKLSNDLGLAFYSKHGDVKNFANKKKIGVQEAARILRYEFLEWARINTESEYIATAHNADDQAEEVILRLIRGASLPGLSGIPWARDNSIIRPLLGVTREQILSHLKVYNIPFVIDQSNDSRVYLRNRIRKDLLPLLAKDFNPAIVSTVNRTAEILAEDHHLLEKMAKEAYQNSSLSSIQDRKQVFNIKKIITYPGPIRRRIYIMALKNLNLYTGKIKASHLLGIDDLVTAKKPCASLSLPGGAEFYRCYEEFFISSRSKKCILDSKHQKISIRVIRPGRWPVPLGQGHVDILLSDIPNDLRSRNRKDYFKPLWLNLDKIKFPLYLRNRKPGDIFWPLGASGPFKLKKFLISNKIPRGVRDSLPLLTSEKNVLAVVGVEISHPYRLFSKSRKALFLQWLK